MKIVIAIAFILIIASLASALVFLMKGKGQRTVHALALRVGFSIALFVLILVLAKFGYIKPTGIY